MIDFEIVTIAPPAVDYPEFRKRLRELSAYAKKIHYLFSFNSSIGSEIDYGDFIRNDIPFCNFIDIDVKYINDHWYNAGLNLAVTNHCTSEYVLFIEPDFIVDIADLMSKIQNFSGDVLTYGVRPTIHPESGTKMYPRISPAFFLAKRSLVLAAGADFREGTIVNYKHIEFNTDASMNIVSAPVDEPHLVDCFNKLTNSMLSFTNNFELLCDYGVTNYYHYSGVTHNFTLCRLGMFTTLHMAAEFMQYLKNNLDIVGINYDSRYINKSNEYITAIEASLQQPPQ
jgi:hypothetical protein